ncbi:hypothetical protein [Gramella sp. AN32]|uniref:Uncharacterized protein n=1 Tax=Christiangramia antarctica TaxID=2058158 RepID=A0ABW5XAJ6_9FLAO|nr:hypothetical protein [Gramella sp. AN32]
MGALINLIISLIMGATFGNEIEEAVNTAQFQSLEPPTEIFQKLENRQEILYT